MGGKRRLDVDQVVAVGIELAQLLAQGATLHQPVFRVKRQIMAWHPHHLFLLITAAIVLRVGRRHQRAADADLRQHAAKAAYRRGYAVHPWKIHIRQHQYPHGWLL